MKILHICNFDSVGGAGIATYRLHTAIEKAGGDSWMLVRTKGSSDPFVSEVGSQRTDVRGRKTEDGGQGGQASGCGHQGAPKAQSLKSNTLFRHRFQRARMAFQRLPVRARGWLGAKLTQVLGMKGCSLNIFPTGLHKILNASDADVIHLHWVNNEMISIRELAKIKKPVVWTFHDMWPFCGAEHYTNDNRYVTGYQSSEFRVQSSECNPDEQLTDNQQLTTDNRRPLVDVDRWTFLRKQKHWKNWHPYIVTPSNWLADCARQSVLFKNLPVDVIPNCLDLGIFKPMNQQCVRRELNLPENKKLVLFGAYDPSDRRKGGDLLESALQKMNTDEVELVVFGASNGPQIAGMRTHWMGKISDEADLSRLYASVDVLAAPSRMDNLPNTVAEALACGTPVVAFNIGGIPDMVEHQRNGWLAEPFDVADFAKGIEWVLSEDRRSEDRCQKSEVSDWESKSGTQSGNARAKAGALFSESSVAAAYQAVYAKVLAGANS